MHRFDMLASCAVFTSTLLSSTENAANAGMAEYMHMDGGVISEAAVDHTAAPD